MPGKFQIDVTILSNGKFPLGRIVATPNAQKHLSNEDVSQALARHLKGDWGLVEGEDKKLNDEALTNSLQILSAYETSAGIAFWIITENDRSATTILLPEDY